MFVFAAKLPLESINDTLDAGLENVNGDADGSPPDTDDGGPERPEDVSPVESD